jgi:ABC-type arginine transport system permease subunit
MIETFYIFVERTKYDCIYIGVGLVILLSSLMLKLVFNTIVSTLVNIIGILILYYALMSIAKNTKEYVDKHPEFLYESGDIRKNVLLSGVVAIMLIILIVYVTYTLFF